MPPSSERVASSRKEPSIGGIGAAPSSSEAQSLLSLQEPFVLLPHAAKTPAITNTAGKQRRRWASFMGDVEL
jgi:hypothetical protein